MELPRLPERPEASALSVEDIVEHARRGRVRVPRFQTGLRWKSKHVREFFDSIVRGFPVGGLLLWKREAPAEFVSFGPVEFEAPSIPDALYVVDGQQRVTALVGAILHPAVPPLGDTYSVWVDLVSGAFDTPSISPVERSWIPLNVLGNRTKLLQWSRALGEGADAEMLVARAFEVEAALMRYSIPVYTVRDADPHALRLIFSRVNTAGVTLKESEVFDALFGDEQRAAKPLDELSAELDQQTGFGRLEPNWLLRCVKAVGGIPERHSFDEHRPASKELLARVHRALRIAIQFLQRDAKLIHSAVLPYRFPLIVLARVFDRCPIVEPRNRQLLARWVWRGALSSVHSNSNQAAVAAHLADISPDPSTTIKRLLQRTPSNVTGPDPGAQWYGQAAASRLYATVMLLEGPLDMGGVPVSAERMRELLSELDLGDVFRPVVKSDRSIANRVFWPKGSPPISEAAPDVLASVLIDPDGASMLHAENDDDFVVHRSELLKRTMQRWVRLLAAPGDSDRPSISSILATGT